MYQNGFIYIDINRLQMLKEVSTSNLTPKILLR